MTASHRSRRRLLAATAALGVTVVLGGVPAAYGDDGGVPPGGQVMPSPATPSASPDASDGRTVGPAEPLPSAGPGEESGDEPGDEPTADPTEPAPTGAPSALPSVATAVPTARPQAVSTTTAPPIPDFGDGKYRVGVKIASGAYVPAGTTTEGSTLRVAFTGGGDPQECTTGVPDDDGTSYCTVVGPQGGTVTATQVGANANLVPGAPVSVAGCVAEGDPPFPCTGPDLVVTDDGTPPSAEDDADTTPENASVDVDVLANDDDGNGAPVTDLQVSTAPGHGTASFVASGSGGGMAAVTGPVVRYVPAAGFVGSDRFRYTLSTANGSATATVTVTVTGSAPGAPTDPTTGSGSGTTSTTATPRAAAAVATGGLPDTGGPDGRLLGLGVLLVGAGGVVGFAGRRRPTKG